MKNITNVFLGIAFIVVGILTIMSGVNIFPIARKYFWPLAVIIPGLFFELTFFSRRKKGFNPKPDFLISGGILLVTGALLYINSLTNYEFMPLLWPFFILAPITGLFQFYWFGERNKGILMAIGTLFSGFALFITISLINVPIVPYILSVLFAGLAVYLLLTVGKSVKKA